MKYLEEMIMKDLGWKILSFVIAISLWFMVINIEHPVDSRAYTQNLQVENMNALAEHGLIVSNLVELESTKVGFKAKAQRTALDRLSRYKGKIFVSIDLQNAANTAAGDIIPLEVKVLLPEEAGGGFEILSQNPVIVNVKIEKRVFKEFPVTLSLEGGQEKNVVLGEVAVLPKNVVVSGPESAVEQVVAVKGALPVDNTVETIDKKLSIHPYDKAGTVVQGVSLSAKEVRVVAGMYQSKEIPLKVNFAGVAAEGYGIGEITMTPQKVMVYGDKTALKNLTVCQLPEVSVESAIKDVEKTFNIGDYMPDGVSLANGETLAKVRIHIMEQKKVTLLLPVEKIAINGADATWKYDFLDKEVQVQCTGPAEVIESLTAEQITGSIDVTGLRQGQKKVEVKLILPQKVTVVGTAPRVFIDIKEVVGDNADTDIDIE